MKQLRRYADRFRSQTVNVRSVSRAHPFWQWLAVKTVLLELRYPVASPLWGWLWRASWHMMSRGK